MNEQKKNPYVKIGLCNNCGICVESCPVGCLAMTLMQAKDKKRRYPYMPNPLICTGCGICAEDCPIDAIEMVIEEEGISSIQRKNPR